MLFEKTVVLTAPAEHIWRMMLDPEVIGTCVPGMETVEIIDDTHYLLQVYVKVAFVSARFKVRTTIVEAQPPLYLRSEGAGEDAGLANSFRQSSEIFLTDNADGTTHIRMVANMDIFGRLGALGLNIVKVKIDRMWEECVGNFADHVHSTT